jgi:alkylhydroperoxidase family enzyme
MPDPIAWIDHVPPADWKGDLADQLAACRDPRTGAVDHILAVHSLHPAGLAGHLALYRAAMEGCETLPRVDCELVALLVSAENDCHY